MPGQLAAGPRSMDYPHGESPLVTIAIPTYNRADRFLPVSLAAACGQTYDKLEILVSDNASSDSTRALVESFEDVRIRYHRHPENIGAVANINSCIQQASGDYTLLLMDDDCVDPDFVEVCVAAARENPRAGIVRTGTRAVDDRGQVVYEALNRVVGLSFTDFMLAWAEGRTAPFLCSTLFRSDPLKASGMHSRHDLWADVLTELKIAAQHGRVDVPEIKASFCLHEGELTVGADIMHWCEDSLELLDVICSLVPDDAARLREHMTPFFATFNYRNALRLRKPWPDRLRACMKVNRLFGKPPQKMALVREVMGKSKVWAAARSSRRALRSYLAP